MCTVPPAGRAWAEAPEMSFQRHNNAYEFTFEDEVRERSELTPAESEEVANDMLGLQQNFKACHISDEESQLRQALHEFDAELSKIPESSKTVYLEAVKRHPELVDDAHKALFLQASNYNTKLATKRIVQYWRTRQDLFGPEKCFLPLTLRGALKHDVGVEKALSQGYFRILPHKDAHGRAIMFIERRRHDPFKYSNKSFVRAIWYIYHVMLEDPEIQKLGLVIVGSLKNSPRRQHDVGLFRDLFSSLPHFLIKHRAVHYCYPDSFLWFSLPIVKFIANKTLRLRFVTHTGTEEGVLSNLANYGLLMDSLPVELGGKVSCETRQWICGRLQLEASTGSNPGYLRLILPSKKSTGIPPILAVPSAQRKKNWNRYGSKGDSRMKLAVDARMNDPKLEPLDALLLGGYTFPGLGEPGMTDFTLFDKDGVSMKQRKNQLSRRVRCMREQHTKGATDPPKFNGEEMRHAPFVQSHHKSRQSSEDVVHVEHSAENAQIQMAAKHNYTPAEVRISNSDRKSHKRQTSSDSFCDTINELPGINDINFGTVSQDSCSSGKYVAGAGSNVSGNLLALAP